jgi:hypothetical protein
VTLAAQAQLTLQGGATNQYLGSDASLNLATGSTVNLNFAGHLAPFGTLFVNGVAQPPGVYGPPGSGAPNELPQFTGSGTAQAAAPVAKSRKAHNAAGNLDIFLPLTGTPGIECRRGSGNDDHQIIVQFPNNVTFTSASVTTGSGSVSSATATGAEITVNLTGITNAQTITVTLFGINDGINIGDLPISIGMLVGDTNGDGKVNSGDAIQTRSRSGQQAGAANFRSDVNFDGTINGGDAIQVRARSGTSLTPPAAVEESHTVGGGGGVKAPVQNSF